MTPEQYERWEDFSLRAAKTWYATSRRPSAKWVLETVEEFFDGVAARDVPLIVNWDHCNPYPGKTDSYGRSVRPYGIGSQVTLFLDEVEPYHAVVDNNDDDDAYDQRLRLAHKQWDEQWGGAVYCCIRAGLDMACAPSAGVVGFTAGDIRKMYPEGVPEWLFPPDERLMYALSDVENGTFAELPDNAPLWL